MNKLAIFDCDGTLVDSGGPIYSALKASLEQNGFAVPPSNVTRRVIGLSLIEAMAALLPDATPDQHARLADDYKHAFIALRASDNVDEPLFEGIDADSAGVQVQLAADAARQERIRPTIFAVPDDRMTDRRHVRAKLMRSPRQRL